MDVPQPRQFLILTTAGWLNRHQQAVLTEEAGSMEAQPVPKNSSSSISGHGLLTPFALLLDRERAHHPFHFVRDTNVTVRAGHIQLARELFFRRYVP